MSPSMILIRSDPGGGLPCDCRRKRAESCRRWSLLSNWRQGAGVSLCIVTALRRMRPLFLVAVATSGVWHQSDAHARADLQGIEVTDVHEAEHTVSVRIEGLFAAFESRQVIVNPGDRDTEIFYAFDLPGGAAVTGVEIRLPDGRRAVSSAVDARAAFQFVAEEDRPGRPDLGLLRMLDRPSGRDDLDRYELRVFPVPARKSAVAVVRWQVPLRYRDGRLQL